MISAKKGNDDAVAGNEVVITAVAQTSPNPAATIRVNSFSFDHFPRWLTAVWRPVAGAAKYNVLVEHDWPNYSACGGVPLGCTKWSVEHRNVTTATHLTFEFTRYTDPAAGRWRVVALDAAGRAISMSEYMYFAFRRGRGNLGVW